MPQYIAWSEDLGDTPPETWDPSQATEHDCAADAASECLLSRPDLIEPGAVALVSVMDETGAVGDYRLDDMGDIVPRKFINHIPTGNRGEGFTAYCHGYSLLDNPYRPGNSYYCAWEGGWYGAQAHCRATDEYLEGYTDFHDGVALENNPYDPRNHFHDEWERGWKYAKETHLP